MGALGDRIDAILELDPEAPAVEFEGRWSSWGDLASAMSALDAALIASGLAEGSRVGVCVRNHAAMLPAILAVIANRCLVTFNPMQSPAKLAEDIAGADVPAMVGIGQDLDGEEVRRALAASGCLVLEMTGRQDEPVQCRQPRSRDNLASARSAAPDIALEMLTSGTTGAPKRVPMRREAFETAVFGAARFEKGRGEGDRPQLRRGVQLLMAPLAHISGTLAFMNALVAGRSIALLERFRVETFRDAVRRHGIKAASVPPAALKMIYDAGVPVEDLASLKAFRVGTAPLDPDLADAVYERYAIPILQNYGATEFGGVAGWTLDDFVQYRQSRRGSVGRLNPGVEGRVVDPESFTILPPGEVGILELRSTQIGDGESWTRTTDLARLDADNFLWIAGRADSAIIRGGFKVHPEEVAKALQTHPSVSEAAVIGLADARLGQVPGAAYLIDTGQPAPAAEELAAFLRRSLSSYQVPVLFHAVAELPRTGSMKVDQRALREILQPLYDRSAAA